MLRSIRTTLEPSASRATRNPSPPRLRAASASSTEAGAACGQSQRVGSSRSTAMTSSAPRRSNSKAQKPSKVPTSSARRPRSDAGSGRRSGRPRRSNQPGVTLPGASSIEWYHCTARHPMRVDREELREYLGDAYDEDRLRGYATLVDEELARVGDEQRLYRVSEAYLYDLTAFAMTGTKDPYRAWIPPPPLKLLDLGCGIGSDGLALLERGYDVTFADFDNPSTRYLRWRLERRGLSAPVVDLDQGWPDGPFDLAYAFDVLEHVPDPFATLRAMEDRASLVLVNFLEGFEPGGIHARELPIGPLLEHVRAQNLLRHEVFYGRSHLVLYEPARTGPPRTSAA